MHDLAAEHPDKVRELVNIWFSEAGANGAFPLDDRSPVEILGTPRPQLTAARSRYVYRPGAAVPEWQAVNTRNRSFAIGALVNGLTAGAQGVLFSMGSRFGGHALYVKDNRLHYVNSFVGQHRTARRRHREHPDRRRHRSCRPRSTRTGTTPTARPARCRSSTATRRSGRVASRPNSARSRSRVRTCMSDATPARRSPRTTRATRRTPSRVARSTGSRST